MTQVGQKVWHAIRESELVYDAMLKEATDIIIVIIFTVSRQQYMTCSTVFFAFVYNAQIIVHCKLAFHI